METIKLNNDMAKSSPSAAGFFCRRIGRTLFKVRVYTGSGYADTLDGNSSDNPLVIFLKSDEFFQ